MSTYAIDYSSRAGAADGSAHSYVQNLGAAARAFIAALLAVEPRQAVDGEVRESAAMLRARAKDVAMVNRMADRYQSMSPNLAAELRFMASRG